LTAQSTERCSYASGSCSTTLNAATGCCLVDSTRGQKQTASCLAGSHIDRLYNAPCVIPYSSVRGQHGTQSFMEPVSHAEAVSQRDRKTSVTLAAPVTRTESMLFLGHISRPSGTDTGHTEPLPLITFAIPYAPSATRTPSSSRSKNKTRCMFRVLMYEELATSRESYEGALLQFTTQLISFGIETRFRLLLVCCGNFFHPLTRLSIFSCPCILV